MNSQSPHSLSGSLLSTTIGQNYYFSWPHRESVKMSLEFFQSPEWLAGRGWECLMIYQGSMPAINGQINDIGGGEIRD